MGRERPRPLVAKVAPRPAGGVAHAPRSVLTLSGGSCLDLCSDRRPTSVAICRSTRSGSAGHSRVHQAVDLVVVLRCTQRLLLRLKQLDDGAAVRSTTRLADWYGNLIRMGNRHVLLFISERSRLPIMIPVRQGNRLRSAFPDAVCQMLGAFGVPAEAIESESLQMAEIAFGRTRSRSLLGSLNDFSLMARMHFITRRTDPLELIARELAETPLILRFTVNIRARLHVGFSTHSESPSTRTKSVAPVRDFPGALGRVKARAT
jgi:hypothetical protein